MVFGKPVVENLIDPAADTIQALIRDRAKKFGGEEIGARVARPVVRTIAFRTSWG